MLVPTNVNQSARLKFARQQTRHPPPIFIEIAVWGSFSASLASASLQHVAHQHSALRTYFPDDSITEYGECLEPSAVAWPVPEIDLRGLPAEQAQVAEKNTLAKLRSPFHPGTSPLYRAMLFRKTDHSVLGISIDHLIFDGLSTDLFIRDFVATYSAAERGAEPPICGSRAEEFATMEKDWINSGHGDRAQQFWERVWQDLGPYPPLAPSLCMPSPPRPETSSKGCLTVPPCAVKVHQKAVGGVHVSAFAMVAAAALLSLHEFGGGSRCGLIFHSARRQYPAVAGIIGCLNNPLILDADFSRLSSVGTTMRTVSLRLLEALEHEMMPFDHLLQKHVSEFGESRAPYLLMNSISTGTARVRLGSASAEIRCPDFEETVEGRRLELVVTPLNDGGIRLDYAFSPDYLDGQLVADFIANINDIICGRQ